MKIKSVPQSRREKRRRATIFVPFVPFVPSRRPQLFVPPLCPLTWSNPFSTPRASRGPKLPFFPREMAPRFAEILNLQKHRQACAKAAALELKHLDPNREFSDREHEIITDRMDDFFLKP